MPWNIEILFLLNFFHKMEPLFIDPTQVLPNKMGVQNGNIDTFLILLEPF